MSSLAFDEQVLTARSCLRGTIDLIVTGLLKLVWGAAYLAVTAAIADDTNPAPDKPTTSTDTPMSRAAAASSRSPLVQLTGSCIRRQVASHSGVAVPGPGRPESGKAVENVRPVRDKIERRVRRLLDKLGVPARWLTQGVLHCTANLPERVSSGSPGS